MFRKQYPVFDYLLFFPSSILSRDQSDNNKNPLWFVILTRLAKSLYVTTMFCNLLVLLFVWRDLTRSLFVQRLQDYNMTNTGSIMHLRAWDYQITKVHSINFDQKNYLDSELQL